MPNKHSAEDVLDFLAHAGERGLMPAATAQALAVATRNVFAVLDESEKSDLPLHDLDSVIRRFNNKRARDFTPTSLKEYARRVRRAADLYLKWKNDPANFSVRTRATSPRSKAADRAKVRITQSMQSNDPDENDGFTAQPYPCSPSPGAGDGYATAFPVRAGQVVTVSNIPLDLTNAEADRLAQFIRMLAPQ